MSLDDNEEWSFEIKRVAKTATEKENISATNVQHIHAPKMSLMSASCERHWLAKEIRRIVLLCQENKLWAKHEIILFA